jgi:hypothetical protein
MPRLAARRFAGFKNGKPGDDALHKSCFPCHCLPKIATSSSPVTRRT